VQEPDNCRLPSGADWSNLTQGSKKGGFSVNKFEQLQEVSVSEMASVDGGGIWFPIIFGIVRFGLANANHNGSSSSSGMTNREVIESLGTKWPK
jgi:hypothetical protein